MRSLLSVALLTACCLAAGAAQDKTAPKDKNEPTSPDDPVVVRLIEVVADANAPMERRPNGCVALGRLGESGRPGAPAMLKLFDDLYTKPDSTWSSNFT